MMIVALRTVAIVAVLATIDGFGAARVAFAQAQIGLLGSSSSVGGRRCCDRRRPLGGARDAARRATLCGRDPLPTLLPPLLPPLARRAAEAKSTERVAAWLADCPRQGSAGAAPRQPTRAEPPGYRAGLRPGLLLLPPGPMRGRR